MDIDPGDVVSIASGFGTDLRPTFNCRFFPNFCAIFIAENIYNNLHEKWNNRVLRFLRLLRSGNESIFLKYLFTSHLTESDDAVNDGSKLRIFFLTNK